MKTLVTGASGFVGSAIVRQLLNAGHNVRVLLRSNSPRDNIEGLDVEIAVGDLTDTATLKQAATGCSALFHAAADYRLWAPHPQSMYAANVDGTRNIMQAALDAGVQRIVYTSSVATLGIHQDGTPADEETPSALDSMIGHYKRSKFMAETLVHELVKKEGLPAVIVNPSTPVGPRDIKPTPTGKMILDAARGRRTQHRTRRRCRRRTPAGAGKGNYRRTLHPGWREHEPEGYFVTDCHNYGP